MARLAIMNFADMQIPELGSKKPVPELSPERITMAVRESLKIYYGFDNVQVCSTATLGAQVWRGRCRINGTERHYQVMENSYGSNS
jgi:hypothetical protein